MEMEGSGRPIITSAEQTYEVLKEHDDQDYLTIREEIIGLNLNNANKILGVYKGFSGDFTAAVAEIRLILAVALKGFSTGIIIFHKHNFGQLNPSGSDKKLTE